MQIYLGEMIAEKYIGLNLVIQTPPPPPIATNVHILALLADWKRSFSNLELSSFSLVNFLIRRLISKQISHNFVSY